MSVVSNARQMQTWIFLFTELEIAEVNGKCMRLIFQCMKTTPDSAQATEWIGASEFSEY